MSEEKKDEKKAEAITTASIVASQAEYKGNTQLDRVKVTFIKDGTYAKQGKSVTVHPTTALIYQTKGLIDKGWDKNVVKYNTPDSGTSAKQKKD